MYIDKNIKEYLRLVESDAPFPGGGSVSALVSSLGASLTLMTANLSFEKDYFKKLEPHLQEKVKDSHQTIKDSIQKLNQYIDEDAEGFAQVIKVYEETNSYDKKEHQDRLEESYKEALTAPLKCGQECLTVLKAQAGIVEYGNNETITDVGVGVTLVYAAFEGCLMSVKINLKAIQNKEYTQQVEEELSTLYNEAATIKSRLRNKIESILNE